MTGGKIRVGTRGSSLALRQAELVLAMLREKEEGLEAELVPVRTAGDRAPPEVRGEADGKGVFTDDIDEMLLEGRLDIAVHSLKDLPAVVAQGLSLAATPPRADPRDALLSRTGKALADLPRGASVGTGSIRRKAQLLALRSDLKVKELNGNVDTRVRKMEELGLDGIVLAAAGLDRLSMGNLAVQRFDVSDLVPAAGQGTIGIEVRGDDRATRELVAKLSDPATMAASTCERAFVAAIGGDCDVPAGAYASVNGGELTLTGMVASSDGTNVVKLSRRSSDPEGLGRALGEEILRGGGAKVLEGVAGR